MRHLIGLAALLTATAAPAMTPVSKSLLVYSNRYAFQHEGTGLLPATEKVSDYLESLDKGNSFIAKKYLCDVTRSRTFLAVHNEIVELDMLYDVSNCVAKQ
jgi:hypothetical protein